MRYLLLTLSLLTALPALAAAPAKEPFSEERFTQLQQQDALILVDVFASWCPTCARQQSALARYQVEHPEAGLHILEVDFDTDKHFVRRFRAPRQSTLILFRGHQELWFSIAETREDVIFDTLNRAAAPGRQ